MFIIGRHTFNILAEAIQSIIDDYDLESTTTIRGDR